MKNIIKLLTILPLTVLLLCNCEKEKLSVYSNEDSGSSIFFLKPYNTAFNVMNPLDTLYKFSFAYFVPDSTQTKLLIPVKATGLSQPFDRSFKIEVDPNGTLKQGVDFDIDNKELLIPAGKNDTTISLTIYRTASMLEQPLNATIRLLENEYFNTNIKFRTQTSNSLKVPILEYKLVVDDILGPPYAWTVAPYETYLIGQLGAFSRVKFQMILEIFDLDPEVFNEASTKANYFSVANLYYFGSYFKYWLGKEAAAGRLYYDENNVLIQAGAMAM